MICPSCQTPIDEIDRLNATIAALRIGYAKARAGLSMVAEAADGATDDPESSNG
jgi:hypothetical protein